MSRGSTAIRLGIIDTGFDINHWGTSAYIDRAGSVDHVDGDASSLLFAGQHHGQWVLGAMTHSLYNWGGGIDPLLPAGASVELHNTDLSIYQIREAIRATYDVDVVNMSFGFDWPYADTPYNAAYVEYVAQPMLDGAVQGRDGLGVNYVVAAGNSRQMNDDSTFHHLQNSDIVIAAAAMDAAERSASFSSIGENMLTTALGVDVLTTHTGGGLAHVSGTSFAAPRVSAVVAKILEANSGLGYRDVQQIVALASRDPLPSGEAASANGATGWNGGGLTYSREYGFGVIDTAAAVALAETWESQSTRSNLVTATGSVSGYQHWLNHASPHEATFTLNDNIAVEHVSLTVEIYHPDHNDLIIEIISPTGTVSRVTNHGAQPDQTGGWLAFDFGSRRFMGEDAAGTWKVRVVDDRDSHQSGFVQRLDLKISGAGDTGTDLYVFTEDFDDNWTAARGQFTDAEGPNTLNFAAMQSDLSLDLTGETACVVAGASLVFAADAVATTVYLGDGSDRLIGDDSAETIHLRGGDDWAALGGGDDCAIVGSGFETVDGGEGIDKLSFAYTMAEAQWAMLENGWAEITDGVSTVVSYAVELFDFAGQVVAFDTLFPEPEPVPEPEPEPVEDPVPETRQASEIEGLIVWLDASAENGGGGRQRIADLSGNGHDAVAHRSSTRATLTEGYDFDGRDAYRIANGEALNTARSYEGKTFVLAFDAGADIASRQVIYEQGGGHRGIALYLEDAALVLNAWNLREEKWGPLSVSVDVNPMERAVVALDFDAVSGTLTGWKNGEIFGEIDGAGLLYRHGGGIGIGQTYAGALDANGDRLNGGFEGTLFELAAFDRSLETSEIEALCGGLSEKWSPSAGIEAPDSMITEMGGNVLWLTSKVAPTDDFWADMSNHGNIARSATGAFATVDAGVVFGGNDRFVFRGAPELNLAKTTTEKTLTVAFNADDVSGRSVIFEEGGSGRGLMLAIDDGMLIWRGWNRAEQRWEAQTETAIDADVDYVATGVLNADDGTLELWLDGTLTDTAEGAGVLYRHGDQVALGGIGGATRFDDGAMRSGSAGFDGTIREVVLFNEVLEDEEMIALHASLAGDILA